MYFDHVQQALKHLLSQANSDGVISLDSGQPGPTVAIAVLTHGNEISGVLTVARIIDDIDAGLLTLQSGRLQILLANYAILHEGSDFYSLERHRGVDLNRIWDVDAQPIPVGLAGSAEFAVRQRLLPYLGEIDCLIDLHSTSLPSTAMAILLSDDVQTRRAVIDSLDVAYVLLNISEFINGTAMIERHRNDRGEQSNPAPPFSVVIEAGQHFDFATIETNAANVTRLLRLSGIATGRCVASAASPLILETYAVGLAQQPGDIIEWVYSANPASFDRLAAGTHVCTLHGEPVFAQGDSLLVMPRLRALNRGDEMYYLARIAAD